LLLLAATDSSASESDSLINALVKAIENKEVSVQARLQRIDALMDTLADLKHASPERQFDIYNRLYHAYKTFVYDSAFRYAQKLTEVSYALGDRSKIGYANVKLAFILVSSGMFKETFDTLAVAPVDDMAERVIDGGRIGENAHLQAVEPPGGDQPF